MIKFTEFSKWTLSTFNCVYQVYLLYVLLWTFLLKHSKNPGQHSKKWYEARKYTVGGSELAKIMGKSSYGSMLSVIKQKAGLIPQQSSGTLAMWWGTMFEAISERCLEIDLDTKLVGTNSGISAPIESGLSEMHKNSPDGYCVTKWIKHCDGTLTLCRSNTKLQPDVKIIYKINLIEMKNPISRTPKNSLIPINYRQQIWSGLAVSPVANFALFMDTFFRICNILDLGPNMNFNTTFHRYKQSPDWKSPIAWGITYVYAPKYHSKKNVKINETDPRNEAWRMCCRYYGSKPFELSNVGLTPNPIDLGDCTYEIFNDSMRQINNGNFKTIHSDPYFADNRGELKLATSDGIDSEINKHKNIKNEDFYLFGVIPWKIMEISYIPLYRKIGFLEEIKPYVIKCIETANAVRESKCPSKMFNDMIYKEYEINNKHKYEAHTSLTIDNFDESDSD